MKTYTDRKYRTWELAINVALARRAKELLGIDLVNADHKTFGTLAESFDQIYGLLWMCCEPTAKLLNVTESEFAEGLDDVTLDTATEALIGAICDFSRGPKKEILRAAHEKSRAYTQRLLDRAKSRLDSPQIEARIETAIAAAERDLDASLLTAGT